MKNLFLLSFSFLFIQHCCAQSANATVIEKYYERGAELFLKGSYDSSVYFCNKLLKLSPKYEDGLELRAANYMALGRDSSAYKDYSLLIKCYPSHGDYYSSRASVRGSSTKELRDSSYADYSKAISLGDTSALNYYGRGSICYQSGRKVSALIDYSAGMKHASTINDLYLTRAQTLSKMKFRSLAKADMLYYAGHSGDTMSDGYVQLRYDLRNAKPMSTGTITMSQLTGTWKVDSTCADSVMGNSGKVFFSFQVSGTPQIGFTADSMMTGNSLVLYYNCCLINDYIIWQQTGEPSVHAQKVELKNGRLIIYEAGGEMPTWNRNYKRYTTYCSRMKG